MESSFLQIGFVFILASVLGFFIRLFKQPLIVSYIAAGLILSFFGIAQGISQSTLTLLAQFGVAFLLFMVGLELKLSDLRQIGKPALLVGFGQVGLTFAAGMGLSLLLGLPILIGVYLSLALTFSSTVVVVKLLSERNETSSLYGKITIGILLIQDFVAILVLMFLTGFQTQATYFSFVLIFLKGFGFLLVTSLLTKRLIPLIFSAVAKNQELLFLTAVAWCFLFASVSRLLGFSIEIGAFLAGVSLSSLVFHYQISARIRPLRDLFMALFFVGLGMQVSLSGDFSFAFPVLLFSFFVLFVKPLIILFLMGYAGFRKRTSFLTAISLTQISEFSLILIALAQSIGQMGKDQLSLLTGVAILTITASNYLVLAGKKLYRRLAPSLSLFESANPKEKKPALAKLPENHIVLVGCQRTGSDILEFLKKKEENFLVVDLDPEVVRDLEAQNIPCLFGDVTDEEILNLLNLEKANLVISTMPNLEDNLFLVCQAKIKNSKALMMIVASYPEEEEELYRAGADYVVIPHLLGGKHIAHLLSDHPKDLEEYLYSKRRQ